MRPFVRLKTILPAIYYYPTAPVGIAVDSIISINLFFVPGSFFLDMRPPKDYNFSEYFILYLLEGTDQTKGEEHGF
jgi:hypothetical protein